MRDVADFAKASKLPYEIEEFIPESEVYFRNKKFREMGRRYNKRPLFLGYVFVEANIASKDFEILFGSFIDDSTDVIKLLRYGNQARRQCLLRSVERLRM